MRTISYKILFIATMLCISITDATIISIQPVDDTTKIIDVTIPIARNDVLYSEYLDVAIDNPAIDLFSIDIETPSIRQFDADLKTYKTVFDKPVHIVLQIRSDDFSQLKNAKLFLSYFPKSHKQLVEEVIPLDKDYFETKNARLSLGQYPKSESEHKETPSANSDNTDSSKESTTDSSWFSWLTNTITNNNSLTVRMLLVFLLGLLMSLTPCIYPMIPITAGILQSQATKSIFISFLLALSYTVGIATTFAILGLLAAFAGQAMGNLMYQPAFILPLVALLFYLSLAMIGVFDLYIPRFLQPRDHHVTGGSFISAFAFGAVSGIVASPCLSPGLVCLLCLVTTLGSKLIGFLLLFSFGIGLGIPLLIIGTFSSSLSLLPRAGMWMVEVKKIFGFFMMGMCFYFLDPILPWFAKMILIPLFLATIGMYYIFYGIKTHSRTLRFISMALGLLLLIAAGFIGTKSYFVSQNTQEQKETFWKSDYQAALQEAQSSGKNVFLDISAPFCSICKAIEKSVFTNNKVRAVLNVTAIPVKIDGSAAQNASIMKQFNVLGFPTILLINPETQTIITQWGPELYDKPVEQFISELGSVAASKG